MTTRMRSTEHPHVFWNEDMQLPCIEGTRLRVQDIVVHHIAGRRLIEIRDAYPSYTPAEILSGPARRFKSE